MSIIGTRVDGRLIHGQVANFIVDALCRLSDFG